MGGQDAHGIGVVHHRHETLLLPETEEFVAFNVIVSFPGYPNKGIEIVYGQVFGSPHSDGFQVLRAHDRADADAACISTPVGIHAGKNNPILTGHADGGYFHILVTCRFSDQFLRLECGDPGGLRQWQNSHSVILNGQDGQFRSAASDDHSIVACLPKFNTKNSSHTAVAVDSCRGRQCYKGIFS